jgi:hypothetical protein
VKKAGANAALTEYPGATHAYDVADAKERTKISEAMTLRNCSLLEGDNGQIVNAKTGKPFAPTDPCIERGVSIQHDEAATAATREGVRPVAGRRSVSEGCRGG